MLLVVGPGDPLPHELTGIGSGAWVVKVLFAVLDVPQVVDTFVGLSVDRVSAGWGFLGDLVEAAGSLGDVENQFGIHSETL